MKATGTHTDTTSSEKECDKKNPLLRDGSSQQQRILKALSSDYVKIDERDANVLKKWARKYAEFVQYYNEGFERDGDWTAFFKRKVESELPHMALFEAFLKLFGEAQSFLNTLTHKHLDFYYQEVLHLLRKDAHPDSVHILFELSKNVDSFLIEAGTRLKAGKDDTGAPLYFETDRDIVVNKARISDLKNVYVAKDKSQKIQYLYAAPIANSADGLGAEIEDEEGGWNTFGEDQQGKAADERTMEDARIGFAVSSPILFLQEGLRTVTLTMTYTGAPAQLPDVSNGFQVYFSGEEGWVTPDSLSFQAVKVGEIKIIATIKAENDPILKYNEEVIGEAFHTDEPMVKVVLNSQKAGLYQFFQPLSLSKVKIHVDVKGVSQLIVRNDASLLDVSKSFMPFGTQPVIGSSVFIGSEEAFGKKLNDFKLHITWDELPGANLGAHYTGYPFILQSKQFDSPHGGMSRKAGGDLDDLLYMDGMEPQKMGADIFQSTHPDIVNSTFKANIRMLYNRGWDVTLATNTQLFDSSDAQKKRSISITGIGSKFSGKGITYTRQETDNLENLGPTTLNGFIRMDLSTPTSPIRAFGHKEFPGLYTSAAIKKAKATNPDTVRLPNAPYTPKIKELMLDYSSEEEVVYSANLNNAAKFTKRLERYYSLGTFGVAERHPYLSQGKAIPALEQYTQQGHLYIGMENVEKHQTVNLLFQVAEGSADPEQDKQTLTWSYLKGNNWVNFEEDEILQDTTNGLLSSGIIIFKLKDTVDTTNTLLEERKFWIRVTAPEQVDAVSDIINIHSQAVTASFKDNGNDPMRLATPLTAETISKLEFKKSAVKTVTQPYASFGGKLKERSEEYFKRVSERLRHKDRAITIWDYEHLVLEEFPSIYKVKCLNHTSPHSEMAPGNVTVVVVANLLNKNAVNPLRPRASQAMLDDIKTYLGKYNSVFVNLDVKNAEFEEVQVDFKVRFKGELGDGYYKEELKKEIKQFLSPWAFEEGKDIVFQGRIHKSMILNFVEEREYVDYVSCFKMNHYIGGTKKENLNEANASNSAAILVSHDSHEIHILTTDDCECADDAVVAPPKKEGIDYMAVELDFKVR